MPDDPILYQSDGMIATITLNRPQNRNSMTPDVMNVFKDYIQRVRSEETLRALIITGTGNTFCSGADFRRSVLPDPSKMNIVAGQVRQFNIYKPFLELLQVEVPIIAAMNGHAIGGGLGLAMVCDLRVANAEAMYGANFSRLGLTSGMSTTYILPRLIGLPRAAELLFTGRLITGADAAAYGLVNYAEAPEAVLPKALALAQEISEAAPIAVRLLKRSLYRGMEWNPVPQAEWESWVQSATFETADSTEGINALLEKRPPKFSGK